VKPLAIDLYAGLGGWAEGLLAEGYDVIGFDIERYEYWMPEAEPDGDGSKGTKPVEKRGWTAGTAITLGIEGANVKPRTRLVKYPAQLVLQDVLTLHGSQFKDADLIVASPPCQEFSYMAMPWSRAKEKQARILADPVEQKRLTALFDACFRIQLEACEAAGRHIPLVVENVRGAQKWVGRARWNFGSYFLWGDVPALMPMTRRAAKQHIGSWSDYGKPDYVPFGFNREAEKGIKNSGGSWFNIAHNTTSGVGQNPDGRKGVPHKPTGHWTNPDENGTKVSGDWFGSYAAQKAAGTISPGRLHGKGSSARKAASAMIAKIPFALATHIARSWKPETEAAA
jgi:hypothetical protein